MKKTLKELWHGLRFSMRERASYWASIYTTKAVIISFSFFIGGIIGLAGNQYVILLLYKSFGPPVLAYATLPNAIFTLAIIGGLIGIFVSQKKASDRWFDKEATKDPKAQFPDILPAGTQWNQITINFLNEKNVFIIVREFKRQVNYVEMGFSDKRGKKHFPNKQWELLVLLAKKKGVIASDDKDFDFANKKRKQLLAETLQEYFRLEADPFHPYENENSYRIRMTLYPPPEKVSGQKPDFMEFAQNINKAKGEEAGLR